MSAPASSAPSVDYPSRLLSLRLAEQRYGMSRNTFLRFRTRHAIPLLTGGKVHEDDIIAAFDRERRGIISRYANSTKSAHVK